MQSGTRKDLSFSSGTWLPPSSESERMFCVRWKGGEILVTQSCLTLGDTMDCSPPGSAVHGISQVRILKWVVITPPGDLPSPGIQPTSPATAALAGGFFTTAQPGNPKAGGGRDELSLGLTDTCYLVTVKLFSMSVRLFAL